VNKENNKGKMIVGLVGVVIGVAAAASIDDVNTVLTETSLPGKPMSSPYAVGKKNKRRIFTKKNKFFLFFLSYFSV
jgi:hypothetical protein